MSPTVLLYAASLVVTAWGIAHIAPTKGVVKAFGELSPDNRRIITMEWVAEGMALVFIGVLVFVVTLMSGGLGPVASAVYWLSAGMLLIMAVWTLLTGARTNIVPIKICPAIKMLAAALIVAGNLL
jgi:hypothetical protein